MAKLNNEDKYAIRYNSKVSAREMMKALRDRRNFFGIAQSTMANQTGIGKDTLYEIESGKREVTLSQLICICNVLDIQLLAKDVYFEKRKNSKLKELHLTKTNKK